MEGVHQVQSSSAQQGKYTGIFSRLHARLKRNRLGELLVLDGRITPLELRGALAVCRTDQRKIGRVLVERELITAYDVGRALTEQLIIRLVAALLAIFIAISSLGIGKNARAGSIKDVPQLMRVANATFTPLESYPSLFGSTEKRSGNLRAFTKWTGMFERFEKTMHNKTGQDIPESLAAFKGRLAHFGDQPLHRMAMQVNSLVNLQDYNSDDQNYGKSDYWATPLEFLANGGDCEDFAIAKYTALRALGVPEERLRMAIVQDLQKDIPHAVLVVYTDQGPYILDNQTEEMLHANKVAHYKPIFSINRDAWWLHTKPADPVTIVASAAR